MMLTYMNTAAAARTRANSHAFMVFPFTDRIPSDPSSVVRLGLILAGVGPRRRAATRVHPYMASAEKKTLLIRISSCYLPGVSAGRDGCWTILTAAEVIEGLRPGRAPP